MVPLISDIFFICLSRNSPAIRLATKISLAWYLRNYVRVCYLVQQLPPILACAFFCNLQSFRRYILSFGFHYYTYEKKNDIQY